VTIPNPIVAGKVLPRMHGTVVSQSEQSPLDEEFYLILEKNKLTGQTHLVIYYSIIDLFSHHSYRMLWCEAIAQKHYVDT
jgi:hypothetical protein